MRTFNIILFYIIYSSFFNFFLTYGALTSKTYAYVGRPWELKSTESPDILEPWGFNLSFETRGLLFLRILPTFLNIFNINWISDLSRFGYLGLNKMRFSVPMISKKRFIYNFQHKLKMIPVSWDRMISRLSIYFLEKNTDYTNSFLFLGPLLNIELLLSLKFFFNKLHPKFKIHLSNNNLVNIGLNSDLRNFYFFNQSILPNLYNSKLILLFGCDIRTEIPLLAVHFRYKITNAFKKNINSIQTIHSLGIRNKPISVLFGSFGLNFISLPKYYNFGAINSILSFLIGKHYLNRFFFSLSNAFLIVGSSLIFRLDSINILNFFSNISYFLKSFSIIIPNIFYPYIGNLTFFELSNYSLQNTFQQPFKPFRRSYLNLCWYHNVSDFPLFNTVKNKINFYFGSNFISSNLVQFIDYLIPIITYGESFFSYFTIDGRKIKTLFFRLSFNLRQLDVLFFQLLYLVLVYFTPTKHAGFIYTFIYSAIRFSRLLSKNINMIKYIYLKIKNINHVNNIFMFLSPIYFIRKIINYNFTIFLGFRILNNPLSSSLSNFHQQLSLLKSSLYNLY